MNTPAHLLLGTAAFGRTNYRAITIAAIIGALLPDLSLYLLVAICVFILDIPASVVFDELYFSDSWQLVFMVDNSFLLWGLLLFFGIGLKKTWLIALAGAALLHLVCDFPLHHDDARAHFWPLTDWRFISPLSYWDTDHFAGWVAPVEVVLSVAAATVVWKKHHEKLIRGAVILLVLLELIVIGSWIAFF